MKKRSKAVIALGGNAISPEGGIDTIKNQFNQTRKSLEIIKDLIDHDYDIVITHGNGPQVGNALLRTELTSEYAPTLPLGICIADVEGGMGYMIQQSLQNLLKQEGIHKNIVTIITQTIIDENDPEISNPTKFIGQRYNDKNAMRLAKKYGWTIKKTSDGQFQRTVSSPKPISIVESETITQLVNEGKIVIAAGGGGIPVYITEKGNIEGFDAVIDKDLASSILAQEIGARFFVIITNVANVYLNFGKKTQQAIHKISYKKIIKYMSAYLILKRKNLINT